MSILTKRASDASKSRTVRLERLIRLIVCSLAALLIANAGAATAQAFTTEAATGAPGTVYVPSVIANSNNFTITNQARTITESPRYRGSWQWVCVTHRLWQWIPGTAPSIAPSWKVIKNRHACAWIDPASDRIRDGGALFTGLGVYAYYHSDVTVTWQARSGALLGRIRVNYSTQSDYSCYGPCYTTSRDGVALAYFSF